jgi:hypothetical protein
VTLRARWGTLRARWVTLRARWGTLRARWVTLRARWGTLRARWVTLTQAPTHRGPQQHRPASASAAATSALPPLRLSPPLPWWCCLTELDLAAIRTAEDEYRSRGAFQRLVPATDGAYLAFFEVDRPLNRVLHEWVKVSGSASRQLVVPHR